ncbi:hypothetical protein POX_g08699 [Penicillium oxalicum]|uniref:hypothetical protein n=1 Tax=Penicillium oxalicum TaxID=69781 RepID=UPI0020B82281|nr:hypothetical protein POX_g08699 [Penicillium oxalicum]KAI2786316.1 hypothetical protein POX_g08699 [Penicillium oxalicum]
MAETNPPLSQTEDIASLFQQHKENEIRELSRRGGFRMEWNVYKGGLLMACLRLSTSLSQVTRRKRYTLLGTSAGQPAPDHTTEPLHPGGSSLTKDL